MVADQLRGPCDWVSLRDLVSFPSLFSPNGVVCCTKTHHTLPRVNWHTAWWLIRKICLCTS